MWIDSVKYQLMAVTLGIQYQQTKIPWEEKKKKEKFEQTNLDCLAIPRNSVFVISLTAKTGKTLNGEWWMFSIEILSWISYLKQIRNEAIPFGILVCMNVCCSYLIEPYCLTFAWVILRINISFCNGNRCDDGFVFSYFAIMLSFIDYYCTI